MKKIKIALKLHQKYSPVPLIFAIWLDGPQKAELTKRTAPVLEGDTTTCADTVQRANATGKKLVGRAGGSIRRSTHVPTLHVHLASHLSVVRDVGPEAAREGSELAVDDGDACSNSSSEPGGGSTRQQHDVWD